MRAWWTQFREINKSVFRLKSDDFSYFTIIGLVAAIGSVVAAFFTIYVRFLKFTVGLLVSDAALRAGVQAVSVEGHLIVRLIFMLAVMLAVYLLLFMARAPQALGRRAKLAADAQDAMAEQIRNLEKDKQALVPKADFRDQLAAAVGVSFLSVRRVARITTYDGDAEMRQEEAFLVSNLQLRDIVRRIGSDCRITRHNPIIEVVGLPQSMRPTKKFRDLSAEAGMREYTVSFDPPLERMDAPATLLIQEEMSKLFYLSLEDIPSEWNQSGQTEHIGHMVFEPTEHIAIQVEFPLGYNLPQGSASIRVNYGRGETRHSGEERRLMDADALKIQRKADGGVALSMDVPKPLLGLTYMLCWKPLVKAQTEVLRQRFAPTKQGS